MAHKKAQLGDDVSTRYNSVVNVHTGVIAIIGWPLTSARWIRIEQVAAVPQRQPLYLEPYTSDITFWDPSANRVGGREVGIDKRKVIEGLIWITDVRNEDHNGIGETI